MVLFLLYCILILCLFVVLFLYLQKEENEMETFFGVENRWVPDVGALETYCVAKNVDVGLYKKAIYTSQYHNEKRRIMRLFDDAIKREREETQWIKEVRRWSCVITDGSVEYGYAFTLGHTMYLPISYIINRSDEDVTELVFHELRHIWQRQDYGGFIRGLDPEVWKGWTYKVVKSPMRAVKQLREIVKKGNLVINPDTFQVMAYAENSEHPMYPLWSKEQGGLEYIVRGHSQRIWLDPHPCEWDAREMAQNILNSM